MASAGASSGFAPGPRFLRGLGSSGPQATFLGCQAENGFVTAVEPGRVNSEWGELNQIAREVALPSPPTTTVAERFKKVEHATALLWKVLQIAESTFRRLQGAELLPTVYAGAPYVDGRQPTMSTEQRVAA